MNVYTSNKASEMADKGWPSSLNFGRGLKNFNTKLGLLLNLTLGLRLGGIIFSEQQKTDMSFRIQIWAFGIFIGLKV